MADTDQLIQDLTDSIANIAQDNNELFVAVAALVISLIALIASLLQVAQQYYASAAGYANCDEKVMGRWATATRRKLRWSQFRFEVEFNAPVIFLCAPDNERGPISNQDILFVTGTQESIDETWSPLQKTLKEAEQSKPETKKLHTADNEQATWVTLLAALQTLEHNSREWQQRQYDAYNKYEQGAPPKEKRPTEPPRLEEYHTLVAALQRKRRSWDTMPSSVKRPYATTTMCHIVEMMAILGSYWVEFDRTHARYRAEGNGYSVTGENVSDLGLMFTFHVYGKSVFGPNRVIPVDEIKELCFGVAPTIYRRTLDSRKLELQNDDLRSLSLLQLGSKYDIAETLVVIGCNTNTVNYFLKPGAKHSHLFPITFEILGMIGQTLHIEHSCFRMLPNPTMHVWNRKAFSLRRLLVAYADFFVKIDDVPYTRGRNPAVVAAIIRHLRTIQGHLHELPPKSTSNEALLHIPLLNDLHRALDDADEILTAKQTVRKSPQPKRPTMKLDKKGTAVSASGFKPGHNRTNTELLSYTKESETEKERLRREMVQDVLRSHIQEVLKMINDRRDDDVKTASPSSTFQASTVAQSPPLADANASARMPRFEDIDSAAPEDKQAKFMEVYFRVIRVSVVGSSAGATRRRGSVVPGTVPPPPPPSQPAQSIKRAGTEKSIPEEAVDDDQQADSQEPGSGSQGSRESTTKEESPKPAASRCLHSEDVYHDDIWCTLVFRMMVWLMLHDFNKKDVQNGKSTLLGSRLPVFIA